MFSAANVVILVVESVPFPSTLFPLFFQILLPREIGAGKSQQQ